MTIAVLLTMLISVGLAGCLNAPLSKPLTPPPPPPAPPTPMGRTFYIAPNGNDADPGSEAKPWQTIQHAADALDPGDTVLIKNGTYRDGAIITRSGQPDKPLTFKAYPGQTPKLEIDTPHGEAILIYKAAYIRIDGLELAYTAPGAQAANGERADNGIGIRGNESGQISHHISVVNSDIHGFPGAGIYTYWADYVNLEGNVIHDNALWSKYANSGISLYQNVNLDASSNFHNVIRGNLVYKNENRVKFFVVGEITDGNCIIIDDGRNTQNNSPYPAYKGSTLVENNVCFDNGGRGVHVFSSDNVLARNNTLFKDLRTPNINDGELTAIDASNVRFVNNVVYTADGRRANGTFNATNIVFERNLYFNTTDIPNKAADDLIGLDPQFVQPSTDPASANFRLKSSSPAVDTALASQMPATDLEGHTRPQGSAPDLGAYELLK